MSLDLYQDEAADKLSNLPPVQNPDATFFQGAVTGVPGLAARAVNQGFRDVGTLGAVAPILYDKFTGGGTEVQDKYFKQQDDYWQRNVDYFTPKPNEVGTAGQVVGGLLGTLPTLMLSPGLAVGEAQVGAARELIDKGVSPGTAQAVGAVSGVGLGLGIKLPFLGTNLWSRIATGAAGNTALGMATRGVQGEILDGTPAAGDFKMADGEQMGLDLLLGMAFGGMAHVHAPQTESTPFWEQVGKWAENLKPSDKDAIATLRQAQHMDVDSMPGQPIEATDINAHVDRLKAATEQLTNDQPVEVENLPAANTVPMPDRMADDESRWNEVLTTADTLDAEQDAPHAEDQSVAVGSPAIYKSVRDQLLATGRVNPEQAHNDAMIADAFYSSTAKRLGMTPEALHDLHPLNVTPEAPATEGVLNQEQPKTWYYSELGRQIDQAKINAAPADQWKNYVKGLANKGVKADEVKWSGLEDWLDLQKGKVTKQQIADFMSGNGIKVNEVQLGKNASEFNFTTPEQWQGAIDAQERAGNFDEAERINRAWEGLDEQTGSTSGQPKFAPYQLPGGRNYRELLLTLPDREATGVLPEGFNVVSGRNTHGEQQWSLVGPNSRAGDALPLAPDATREQAIQEATRILKQTGNMPGAADFQSSHFSEPNILAHVRFNDRTDADGKHVLFLEELQGDWPQAYRKSQEAIGKAIDENFNDIVDRMKKAGILEVNCD